jgi:hypothetical protein
MAHFSFTVDTTEMADTVHSVSNHVDGTTVAVIGMQTAVIAAERAAAQTICTHVNRGFHSLIVSQISQRCAKAKSAMDAKLLELKYQSGALRRIKGQMEKDFHRISARYARLFGALDETTRTRVFDLDSASARLAGKEMETIDRRSVAGGAKVSMLQMETVPAMQILTIGRTRSDAVATLDRMETIIVRSAALKSDTQRIIDPARTEERKAISLPAALVESDDLRIDHLNRAVYVAGTETDGPSHDTRMKARTHLGEIRDTLPWTAASEKVHTAVRNRCLDRAAAGGLSDRERAMFARLFDQSTWLTLGGGQP